MEKAAKCIKHLFQSTKAAEAILVSSSRPPTQRRSFHHGKQGNNKHQKTSALTSVCLPFSLVLISTLCTFPYPRALYFLMSIVLGLFASSLFGLISHSMIVLHIILFLYNLGWVIVFNDKTFVAGALKSTLSTEKHGMATDAHHPPPIQRKSPFKTSISKTNDNMKYYS